MLSVRYVINLYNFVLILFLNLIITRKINSVFVSRNEQTFECHFKVESVS